MSSRISPASMLPKRRKLKLIRRATSAINSRMPTKKSMTPIGSPRRSRLTLKNRLP